jgi:hypothetical protein
MRQETNFFRDAKGNAGYLKRFRSRNYMKANDGSYEVREAELLILFVVT